MNQTPIAPDRLQRDLIQLYARRSVVEDLIRDLEQYRKLASDKESDHTPAGEIISIS
jgi:hypothetical protein